MLLFHNGIIHTMNPARPTAELVLVGDDGRIHLVGDMDSLITLPPVKRIDLDGRTLIPGFNDAHVHIWKLGLLLTVQVRRQQSRRAGHRSHRRAFPRPRPSTARRGMDYRTRL